MASPSTDRRLGLSGNTAIKTPCRAATTANITLSGEQTIDGIACVTDDRVLVKDQTTTTANGIYTVDTGAWSRAIDADGNYDWTAGTLILVVSGSTNGSALFEQTTTGTITIDTSSLAFSKIATLSGTSITQAQVQNGQFVSATATGTNTILLTSLGTAPSALATGQFIFFVPANTNTGATTITRDGLTIKNAFSDGAACVGGEIKQNVPALVWYDGTQYNVIGTASPASLNVADQPLTGGFVPTSLSLGTISSGTVTPDCGDRPLQHYTNNGAHTLGVSANAGSILVDITNGASAGAITTSAFTKVTGDAFTTTNTNKFRCHISIANGGSLLMVQALQ